MVKPTRIWTEIDYEKSGKQVGWLHLPHSVTRSAYGTIAIPIAAFKNGQGPTVLLTAGTHGDEYEGQIALCKLIRTLDPATIQGRVIVMPATNLPAALAGTRVSPIDDGNLNRVYPGDPDLGPTWQIAHYIHDTLYPLADYLHDFHSGGSSLDYMPFCSIRLGADEALNARARAALDAFNAPLGLVWAFAASQGTSTGAAVAQGIVSMGGEFGGAGRVSISGVKLVERGIRNLLAHACVIEAKHAERGPPTRFVEVRGKDYYVYAPEPGLFEPFVALGDWVEEGRPCGQVHFVDNPARQPVSCQFKMAGQVMCMRHPGRVERGDCVAHLATDFQGSLRPS